MKNAIKLVFVNLYLQKPCCSSIKVCLNDSYNFGSIRFSNSFGKVFNLYTGRFLSNTDTIPAFEREVTKLDFHLLGKTQEFKHKENKQWIGIVYRISTHV